MRGGKRGVDQRKGIFHHELAKALPVLAVLGQQQVGVGAQCGFEDQRVPPLQLVALGELRCGEHALRRAAHHVKSAQALELLQGLGGGQGWAQFARGDLVELLQHLGAEHDRVARAGLRDARERGLLAHAVARVHGIDEHVGVYEADHQAASPDAPAGSGVAEGVVEDALEDALAIAAESATAG
jgi:hypothetical protein